MKHKGYVVETINKNGQIEIRWRDVTQNEVVAIVSRILTMATTSF
jgi:hypothetical protein